MAERARIRKKHRKGQSFIIGAIIFSFLLLLLFTTTGPTITDPPSKTQFFFSHTRGEAVNVFNDALEENYSAKFVQTRLQSYDSFVERKSLEKGITYSTYNLVVLPDEGEAKFTNHMQEELDVRLKTDSWENKTSLASKQSFNSSFPEGKVSVDLEVKDKNRSHSFTTATPRLLKHSVMESPGETWKNTLLG